MIWIDMLNDNDTTIGTRHALAPWVILDKGGRERKKERKKKTNCNRKIDSLFFAFVDLHQIYTEIEFINKEDHRRGPQ